MGKLPSPRPFSNLLVKILTHLREDVKDFSSALTNRAVSLGTLAHGAYNFL